jgi:hypothetical protein
MRTSQNPLGIHAARIESEYLERLHKVRFGLDRGWRPPGLMLKGGNAEQRAAAMLKLKELALHGGFSCSYLALGPELELRNTAKICRAAIESAGLDPQSDLKRLAASSRQIGREGLVLLIDNIDRFAGPPRARAEAYREIQRWMGALPDEQYVGLFCVLAVTAGFEEAVADPAELSAIRQELSAPEDAQLLDDAHSGLASLDHEMTVHELLVLEF